MDDLCAPCKDAEGEGSKQKFNRGMEKALKGLTGRAGAPRLLVGI